MVRISLTTLVVLACIHGIHANGMMKPIVKATSTGDIPGKYHLHHSAFDFCAPELEIRASGSTITSLTFSGSDSGSPYPCGYGDWETKVYPDSGSGGWGITMGARVQSKLGITCDGRTVSLMVIRAERNYKTEKPLWGTENKYYTYKNGVKYVTFAQNNVGNCIYSENKPGLSKAILGGVIAGVPALLLICITAVFIVMRKKKNSPKKQPKQSKAPEATYAAEEFY